MRCAHLDVTRIGEPVVLVQRGHSTRVHLLPRASSVSCRATDSGLEQTMRCDRVAAVRDDLLSGPCLYPAGDEDSA